VLTCISIPEKINDKTLVVGAIYIINNSTRYKFLDSFFSDGIKVVIRSVDDDKIFELESDKNGLFYSSSLGEGIYEIIELKFRKIHGNTINNVSTPETEYKYFYIRKNKLNNMGLIIWTMDDRNWTVGYSNNFSDVKSEFERTTIYSNYSFYEWIDIGLPLLSPLKDKREIFNYEYEFTIEDNDKYRFFELWVIWNDLVNKRINFYPIPDNNMTAMEYINKNLEFVPETIFTTLEWKLIINIDEEDINKIDYLTDEEREEWIKGFELTQKYPSIIANNNRNLNDYICFNYKYKNNEEESIVFGW
jgi:hypothetical protein